MNSEPTSASPGTPETAQDQDAISAPDKVMVVMLLLGLTVFGVILMLDLASGLFR